MQTIQGGLKSTKRKYCDLKYHQHFGTVESLPIVDFMITDNPIIKDQKQSDFCVAAGGVGLSQPQDGKELSMEWLFQKIKEQEGRYGTWGADPRKMLKVLVKYGVLAEEDSPFTLNTRSRNFIANWNNWGKTDKGNAFELDMKAKKYRKDSYFFIEQKYYKDLFDAFRAALWQNKEAKRAIGSGMLWCPEWMEVKEGTIDKMGTPTTPHYFIFIGQKSINGKIHLVAQLSNGTEIGDNGLFYFTRNVLNESYAYMQKVRFRVQHVMLNDMDSDMAKEMYWNNRQRILNALKRFMKQFIK